MVILPKEVESVAEYFPDAQWQRCVVHFYRNVFSHVPNSKVKQVVLMLKAIHVQESLIKTADKAKQIVNELRAIRLRKLLSYLKTIYRQRVAKEHHGKSSVDLFPILTEKPEIAVILHTVAEVYDVSTASIAQHHPGRQLANQAQKVAMYC